MAIDAGKETEKAPEYLEYTDEEWRKMDDGEELIAYGKAAIEGWTNMAFQEPPKNPFERFLYSIGLLVQTVQSMLMFPAALGGFLLEESCQTYGMGAYLLSTADLYEDMEPYTTDYIKFIKKTEQGAKNLAALSPVTGGAVLIYMQSAKVSARAMRTVAIEGHKKKLKEDQEQRNKELKEQKDATVRLNSRPSLSEIWIDGENTEALTPDTIENLKPGDHNIELRHYNSMEEEWNIASYTISVEAGKRYEMMLPIEEDVKGEEEIEEEPTEKEEPKLPEFLTVESNGDLAKDGDTFKAVNDEWVRLIGIDTPESGRPFYEEAKQELQEQIEDKALTLKIQTSRPFDTYGRTLAEVRNYKGNINVAMLSKGLAKQNWFEEDTFDRTRYQAAEDLAKQRGLGIWKEKYG
jgi:endonuclease YncB( thermonuclease family)